MERMARDITKLHPFVRMIEEQLVNDCAAVGINIKITDCVRTKEEQNGIDASRTGVKYPYSYHNWGLAFDICQNERENPYPSSSAWWNKVGTIGKRLGLSWGGDWTNPVDRPHFQFDVYGSCEKLLKIYGSPEKFMEHSDFEVSTPTTPITTKSSRKKIIWLQVKLNCSGYSIPITGKYDYLTVLAVQKFWMMKTENTCTGKKVSVNCIKLLE